MPPTIAWKPQCGANSFEYELSMVDKNGSTAPLLTTQKTIASQVTFVKNTPTAATLKNEDVKTDMRLDTAYQWRVRACWPSAAIPGHSDKLCDNSWAGPFSFRTTGRPPKNHKAIGDNTSNIPTTFSWEAVPGAQSYILELTDGQLPAPLDKLVKPEDSTKPVSIKILYPDLKPSSNKPYKWKVKTCADTAGTAENCGAWSTEGPLVVTKTLPAPSGLVAPRDLASIDQYPMRLSWNAIKGASAYRVTMNYDNKDTNYECPKSSQLFNVTTTTNSYDPPGLALACLGTYTWTVASCFSSDCKPDETGTTASWKFFINIGGGKSSGLMVCGLRDDDPKTDNWDERKACEFADLFKFVWKLLNFVLFKLSFWLLPILGTVTGVIFYTSAGGPQTLQMVKSWWKAIGIGYAIIFFAYFLTTWALQAMGYSGLWWKIL
jgi:hypothetical protein